MLTRDRVRGMLLGGAIGDAWGATLEFLPLAEIRRRYGSRGPDGYVEASGGVGSITDDTQMTLFTAEGMVRARARSRLDGSWEPVPFVWRAYRRWGWTQGLRLAPSPEEGHPWPDGWLASQEVLRVRRAPGNTCVSALSAPTHGTPETPINGSKGCGGVMRIAPAALLRDEAFLRGSQFAATTHGHPTGHLAAAALASMLARLLEGRSLADAAASARRELAGRRDAQETETAIERALGFARTESATPETVERLGGGWVAEEALAIGLFFAATAADVRSGLRLATCHSGDSDSTGSIAGNLLGAMHGEAAIPEDLIRNLWEGEVVSRMADDLWAHVVEGSPPDATRYPPR